MPSSSPLTGPSKKRGESALEKRSAESQALAGHSTAASSKPTAPPLAPHTQQQLQQEPSVAGFAVTRTGQDASPPRLPAGDSEPKPARRTSRPRAATSAPGGGYTPPDEHGSSALVAAAVDALSFRTASSGLSAAALQQEGVGVSESSSTVSSLLGPRLHHYAAPPSPRRQGAEAHGRPTHATPLPPTSPRSHTAPTTTGGGRGGSAPLGGPHRDPFAVGSEPDFSRFPAPPPPRMMRHLTEAVAAAAAHAAPPPALFTPPHSAAHRRSTRRGRVVASSAGVDRPPVNSPAERLKDTQGEKLKEREGEDGAPTLYSDPARGPTAERGQRHHPQRVGGGEAGETVESMPHPVTPLTSHEESVRSSVGGKKRRSLTSHSSETDSGGRRSHPPSSAVVPLQSTADQSPDGNSNHHYGPRRRSSSGGDGDTTRSSISGTSSRHGEPASRRHSSVSSSDTHSTATARRGSTGSITSLLEHAPSLDVTPPAKSAAGHRNRHGRTSKNGTTTTHSGGGGRRASHSSGSGSSSSTGSSTSDHNHNNDSSSTSPSTTTMSSRSHSQQQQRRRGGGRAVADSRDRRDNSPPVTSRLPNAPLSRRPVVSWRSPARVCAIASVPAGQVLTGGDPSGLIEVWDSRTGRRLCGLGGHQAPVMSLLTVPNSSLLLSGSADRTARLWELRTLQNTLVLEGHRGLIKALASLWMPDVGLNLFTGSDDGTVRQWRAATGVCVHVYRGHRGPVNVVTCLRPVRLIATGGCDGVMKLWNAQTLRCLSSIAAVPSSGAATSGGAAAASAGVGGVAAGVGGSGSGGGGGGGTSTAYSATGGVTGRTAGGSGGARWAGLSSDDGAGHRRHGADADGRDAGGEGDSWNTSGAVWDIAQLEDAQQSIATATDDGAVRLWIMQINQQAFLAKELYLPGVLLKARSGARCLLACGAYVFVGGARGELYVWDTAVLPYVQVGGHHTDRRGSVLQTAGAVAYRVLAPVGQRPAGSGANAGIGSSNTNTGSHAGGGGGGGGGVGLAAGVAAAAGHSNKSGTATVVQRSTSFTSTSGSSVPALSSTNARPSPSPSMTSVSVSTATVATNASGGAAAAADGADGTAGGETYEAAFFFHTAAITGLTRQGAQLTSSSLDHNVCRWDLHEVLPTDTALGMPVLAEQGMGGVGGPPASGQEAVSSPFSWAMRQPSSAAWDFDEGGAYPRSASTASLARWPVDGQAWALDGGGAASAGAAAVVAAAAAAARAPLSASSLGVAGAASSSSGTITTTTTTAAAAQAPTAFASPLALLRNPRRIMEGDAVGAGTEMGTSDSTVTALSPGEAAAAYSELPLVFVVQHLRTAAASPLDIRYLVRTLLLVLLVTFFSLLYGAALQPMVQHGGDITMGLLSQTATYPLPSFARPQTFASITGPESLVRWLLLMVDQLHSLSTPVHILVPALENETGGDVEGESSDSDRSSDASRDSTGTDDGGGTTTTTNNRTLSSSRTTAVAAAVQVPLAAQSARSRELGDSVAAGDDSWWSSSSNSSDSGSNADEGAPPFRRLPPAPLPSQTKLLVLPALPGGLVLLRHLTLRVKHVTDTSCTWNPHFLRQRVSADLTASSSTLSSSSSSASSASSSAAAATMAPPPCYGALQTDTESRATICPDANITALLSRLGPNLTGFPASTPTSCLAHSHAAVGVSYKGYFHHYDGAGYAVQLPLFLNSVTTNALYAPIEAVRRLRLVDNQRTRLVDVLLYTYHIHTKMFFRTHYVLEVPRGGAWIGSIDARPCPVYGLSSDISPRLFVACVAILLAVVLGLLAMVLYDLIMAFYVGELMRYLCSLLVLMDMGVVVMGLAVVGAALRWIAVSRTLHLVTLLRASAAAARPPAATVDGTVADLLMNSISPEYDTQIAHLNRVESAVSYLLIFAAAEAVLLLVSAATIISRHIGFVQTVTATIRQLRVQMLTAVVMMVLALTAFALSFRLLFGARVYAYASVGRGLWHLLLYFVAPTSVHMDAGPLLADLRPTAGKLLLLVLNYLCRVLCYVYWLALLMERLKAVSRNSPHISFRAFCAKWWYDVQYQLALMRQLAPNTVFLTGDADAEDASPSKLKGQAASGRDTSAAGGGGGGAVASRASAAAAASEERASTRRAHLSFSGHRAVIIEHLWRRLRRLQQEQEDARHARMRRHMTSSAASTSAAAATMTPSSSPVDKSGLSNSNSNSNRTRSGAAKGGDTATMTPPPPPPPPQPASAGAAADAAPAYVHVRLTDLLLLLPEDARTPFARNVVRHAWDTLAWMYHYHQQHTLQQFPDEQERRVRLEEGIRDAQRQLEPLFAAVRATQARLEAHEARLRPLAQAVMGMSAGTR